MKIEEMSEIPFASAYKNVTREYKSLNAHRAILELKGNGFPFAASDFETLRKEITSNLKISRLRGFGFGIFLKNYLVPDIIVEEWVDNSTRQGMACQWVIASLEQKRTALGIHMWQKGITTPIYENFLTNLNSEGFAVISRVKRPTGLMKFGIAFSAALKLSMYEPREYNSN